MTTDVRPSISRSQRVDDRLLGRRIQTGRRLVENQDRRVADDRAAIAMRWRWPPESVTPRSPTIVS